MKNEKINSGVDNNKEGFEEENKSENKEISIEDLKKEAKKQIEDLANSCEMEVENFKLVDILKIKNFNKRFFDELEKISQSIEEVKNKAFSSIDALEDDKNIGHIIKSAEGDFNENKRKLDLLNPEKQGVNNIKTAETNNETNEEKFSEYTSQEILDFLNNRKRNNEQISLMLQEVKSENVDKEVIKKLATDFPEFFVDCFCNDKLDLTLFDKEWSKIAKKAIDLLLKEDKEAIVDKFFNSLPRNKSSLAVVLEYPKFFLKYLGRFPFDGDDLKKVLLKDSDRVYFNEIVSKTKEFIKNNKEGYEYAEEVYSVLRDFGVDIDDSGSGGEEELNNDIKDVATEGNLDSDNEDENRSVDNNANEQVFDNNNTSKDLKDGENNDDKNEAKEGGKEVESNETGSGENNLEDKNENKSGENNEGTKKENNDPFSAINSWDDFYKEIDSRRLVKINIGDSANKNYLSKEEFIKLINSIETNNGGERLAEIKNKEIKGVVEKILNQPSSENLNPEGDGGVQDDEEGDIDNNNTSKDPKDGENNDDKNEAREGGKEVESNETGSSENNLEDKNENKSVENNEGTKKENNDPFSAINSWDDFYKEIDSRRLVKINIGDNANKNYLLKEEFIELIKSIENNNGGGRLEEIKNKEIKGVVEKILNQSSPENLNPEGDGGVQDKENNKSGDNKTKEKPLPGDYRTYLDEIKMEKAEIKGKEFQNFEYAKQQLSDDVNKLLDKVFGNSEDAAKKNETLISKEYEGGESDKKSEDANSDNGKKKEEVENGKKKEEVEKEESRDDLVKSISEKTGMDISVIEKIIESQKSVIELEAGAEASKTWPHDWRFKIGKALGYTAIGVAGALTLGSTIYIPIGIAVVRVADRFFTAKNLKKRKEKITKEKENNVSGDKKKIMADRFLESISLNKHLQIDSIGLGNDYYVNKDSVDSYIDKKISENKIDLGELDKDVYKEKMFKVLKGLQTIDNFNSEKEKTVKLGKMALVEEYIDKGSDFLTGKTGGEKAVTASAAFLAALGVSAREWPWLRQAIAAFAGYSLGDAAYNMIKTSGSDDVNKLIVELSFENLQKNPDKTEKAYNKLRAMIKDENFRRKNTGDWLRIKDALDSHDLNIINSVKDGAFDDRMKKINENFSKDKEKDSKKTGDRFLKWGLRLGGAVSFAIGSDYAAELLHERVFPWIRENYNHIVGGGDNIVGHATVNSGDTNGVASEVSKNLTIKSDHMPLKEGLEFRYTDEITKGDNVWNSTRQIFKDHAKEFGYNSKDGDLNHWLNLKTSETINNSGHLTDKVFAGNRVVLEADADGSGQHIHIEKGDGFAPGYLPKHPKHLPEDLGRQTNNLNPAASEKTLDLGRQTNNSNPAASEKTFDLYEKSPWNFDENSSSSPENPTSPKFNPYDPKFSDRALHPDWVEKFGSHHQSGVVENLEEVPITNNDQKETVPFAPSSSNNAENLIRSSDKSGWGNVNMVTRNPFYDGPQVMLPSHIEPHELESLYDLGALKENNYIKLNDDFRVVCFETKNGHIYQFISDDTETKLNFKLNQYTGGQGDSISLTDDHGFVLKGGGPAETKEVLIKNIKAKSKIYELIKYKDDDFAKNLRQEILKNKTELEVL